VRPRTLACALTALIVLHAAAGELRAQDRAAPVTGVVVDTRTGAPLAGVEVELILAPGAERLRTSTASDGRFRFDAVPVGSHRLSARGAAFAAVERPILVPTPGPIRIELTAEALAIDTLRVFLSPLEIRAGGTEFGTRVDARALRLLPLPYDPAHAVRLAPGADGERIWGGAAREANLYQIDGLPLTHPGTGGYLAPISPAWVQAVEVRGLGAGAELGNFQGGVVNVVTRSGTNAWRSRVRSSFESHALNATNIVAGEVGRERAGRSEIEAELGGPLVRGRLFLFGAGHLLRDATRAQARLPALAADRYLPWEESRTEGRGFAKLTWTPTTRDRLDVAGALTRATGDNWGLSGYEAPGAAPDLRAGAHFWTVSWRRQADDRRLALRIAGAGSYDRWDPDAGLGTPALRLFTHGDPPTPVHQNAEFETERRPSTLTAAGDYGRVLHTGTIVHDLTVGAEWTRGRWLDRRLRTAGMTWRPVASADFDPAVPASWFFGRLLPSDWGGEVDLNARTTSQALFAQDRIALHRLVMLDLGLRWGRWSGELLPRGRAAFTAIEDHAWEPRAGLVIDPLDDQDLVIKVHWGRYHQNLLTSFFDRAEGGDVFTNRELWYYRGAPFADPATAFAPADRSVVTADGPLFTREELIRLNQTGPVADDYSQPFVDQWLVGMEKSLGQRVRIDALFVSRRNRDLVALMDRNLDANYHRWTDVDVLTLGGDTVRLGGSPLVLPALHVPNDALREYLGFIQNGAALPMPPGLSLADAATLTFEQDLVLDNVPDAYRDLHQVQLAAYVSYPRWGATASIVWSRLEGNVDGVTGYEAGTDYQRFWELGAGPFVRPNEQVNFDGRLPGISPLEIKAAVHAELPWQLRGGAFLQAARGYRFTPYFTLTGLSRRYFVDGEEIDARLVGAVAGERVFVRPRGESRYGDRVSLDLHLERTLPLPGGAWSATVDVFNLANAAAPTRINESLTHADTRAGSLFGSVDASAVYAAVWQRMPARTIRLGLTAEF
jgi:Carboxypeptidase regulatory-like domain/TonB dependent receptor